MALGSKKRDYKTEDRSIRATIKVHKLVTALYMKEGLSEKEASHKAFEEIILGKWSREIKGATRELMTHGLGKKA